MEDMSEDVETIGGKTDRQDDARSEVKDVIICV